MKRLAWARLDTEGRDEAEVERRGGATVVRGRSEEPRFAMAYGLRYDAAWRCLEAEVTDLRAGNTVHLAREGRGWRENGTPRPDLDGCEDVDLGCTPFTNTPPLLRHAQARDFEMEVVHVRMPPLHAVRARQRYEDLGAGRVRYQGLDTGFETVLEVDAERFVTHYPGFFRRVG